MTPRTPGRHRAPRRLPSQLSGTATVAASGLLVATLGSTTAAAQPQTPTRPLSAEAGVSTAATPAPFFALAEQISEQTAALAADKPVQAAPAPAKAAADVDFGSLGFTGVEPAPVVEEPVVETTEEPAGQAFTAETREQETASRSQARETAPAAQPAAPAPEPAAPAAPAVAAGAEGAISWAMNHLGLPYQWASSSGGGYDCSGFTTAAFRAAGISLPHGSQAQYHATARVSLDNIQRGDLLFYSSNGSASGIFHVAIYLGGGQVVHSLRDWSGGFSGSKTSGLHYSPGLMGAGRP